MVKPKQPKTLSSLTKDQTIFVAANIFGVQLDNKAKVDTLREALKVKMVQTLECSNVACADAPCNPGVHVFVPTEYLPAIDEHGEDLEALMQTPQQQDLPVLTPSNSPRRDPLPQADGLAQQRQLALDALRGAGLGIDQIHELFPNNGLPAALGGSAAPGSVPPASTGTRPKTRTPNVFRGLLDTFSRSTASPRPQHSAPPTPLLGQGVPAQQDRSLHRRPDPVPALHVPGAVQPPPPPPHVPRTLPPAPIVPPTLSVPATTESTLDKFLAVLVKQQEQSQAQAANQNLLTSKLTELLEKKWSSGAESRPESETGPAKGKMQLVPPKNPDALAMTGITVGPRWAMSGDMSSVDMNHVRKHMKSGRAGHNMQDARTSELWPNAYLTPAGDEETVVHEQLTFNMWVAGFVTKIFAEIDPSRNGTPEHNQLRILLKLIRLTELYPWTEVRRISAALFLGLERGALSWTDWAPMETWWGLQLETLRDRAIARQLKRPALPAGNSQPPAGSQPPPAKVQKRNKDIYGVAPEVLKSKRICIKWNVGTCSVKESSHDSPDKSDSQKVRHICGGCWHLHRTEDESHPMKTCRHLGKDGLFH